MTDDVAAATAGIERRITALRATFRICLANLEPLEAICLLGQLTHETLDRFGTERAGVLDALGAELKRDEAAADEDARFEAFAQQLDEDARFEAFGQQLTALCNATPDQHDVITGLFAELAERIAANTSFSERARAVQQFADHLRQYIAEIPPDA